MARERVRWQGLFGDSGVVLAEPYTGHRWLEMARDVVGKPSDPSAPWADDYWDDMGEAVLALLEGRDMKEAVRAYRTKEYVSRHLTIRMDEWKDEGQEGRWFESVMPKAPSAEEEYLSSEPSVELSIPFHMGSNRRRYGNRNKQEQPSERRRKDAGWRKHAA